MKKIKIQIQYFKGCPNSAEMISRVRSAVSQIKDRIDYEEVLVENNELAAKLKFRGSPTLLINGADYEEMPEPTEISLSCRYYPNGLPSVSELKGKFRKLLNS